MYLKGKLPGNDTEMYTGQVNWTLKGSLSGMGKFPGTALKFLLKGRLTGHCQKVLKGQVNLSCRY